MFNKKLDYHKIQRPWVDIKALSKCPLKATYKSSHIPIEELVIFHNNDIDG